MMQRKMNFRTLRYALFVSGVVLVLCVKDASGERVRLSEAKIAQALNIAP